MPFLVIRDGTAAFAAAALWHAVQYIAIVWLYNRRRWRRRGAGGARRVLGVAARAFARLHGSHRRLARPACTASRSVSSLIANLPFERWALTFWTGLTLGHYYLDGVIWKSRRYNLRVLIGASART